jgi:hypothetical protein
LEALKNKALNSVDNHFCITQKCPSVNGMPKNILKPNKINMQILQEYEFYKSLKGIETASPSDKNTSPLFKVRIL